MPVVEIPSAPEQDAQALIEEARRRQRRRWLGCGAVCVALLLGLVGYAITRDGNQGSPPHQQTVTGPGRSGGNGSIPKVTIPVRTPVPPTFVAGDNQGGVALYSTANGAPLKELSAQSAAGPDEQISQSANRRLVYFVQPGKACASRISWVSANGAAYGTIDGPHLNIGAASASAPALSPNGNDMALVAGTCQGGKYPDLVVLRWKIGAGAGPLGVPQTTHAYPAATGLLQFDTHISWSPSGQELALTEPNTPGYGIRLLNLSTEQAVQDARVIPSNPGCTWGQAAFIPHSQYLAAEQRCGGSPTSPRADRVLEIDVRTGINRGALLSLATGDRLGLLSFDQSGQHLLYAITNETREGGLFRLDAGISTLVSAGIPTDASW